MLKSRVEELMNETRKQKGYFEGKYQHFADEKIRFNAMLVSLQKNIAKLEIDNEVYEKQIKNYKEEVNGLSHQKSVLDEKLMMTQLEFQDLVSYNYTMLEVNGNEKDVSNKFIQTDELHIGERNSILVTSIRRSEKSPKVFSITTRCRLSKDSSMPKCIVPTKKLRVKPLNPILFGSPRNKQANNTIKTTHFTSIQTPTQKERPIMPKKSLNIKTSVGKDYGFELKSYKCSAKKRSRDKIQVIMSRDLNHRRVKTEATNIFISAADSKHKKLRPI